MKYSDIEHAIDRELKNWPGATVEFSRTNGGHKYALIRWGDKQFKTFYSFSPTDHRTIKNKIGDIRRTLRQFTP